MEDPVRSRFRTDARLGYEHGRGGGGRPGFSRAEAARGLRREPGDFAPHPPGAHGGRDDRSDDLRDNEGHGMSGRRGPAARRRGGDEDARLCGARRTRCARVAGEVSRRGGGGARAPGSGGAGLEGERAGADGGVARLAGGGGSGGAGGGARGASDGVPRRGTCRPARIRCRARGRRSRSCRRKRRSWDFAATAPATTALCWIDSTTRRARTAPRA